MQPASSRGASSIGTWPQESRAMRAAGSSHCHSAATRGGEPWVRAGLAYVEHDFTRAADLYREIGTVPDEADARLRAAEEAIDAGRRAEGERELERALALWRSLGATAYVLEGEALLAASA